MLHSVEYDVTFAATGRTLSEAIAFRPGFGIVTGANETGKSFAVEMVRWCLFGSAALRGKITDFKKATARLAFAVKGQDYTIERTPSTATLFRGQDEIAVGTRPVNAKVTQLLGFGLEVFDASCVALQGEIEALGAMKPADRKRLVDSVIGLGVIEELAKSAGEEANALKRRARDVSETLREPVVPVKPDGYRPLPEIEAELAVLTEARTRLARLQGMTAETRERPVPPEETVTTPSAELTELAAAQETKRAELRKAERDLAALPSASPYSEADLAGFEAQAAAHQRWDAKQRLLAANPDPGFTVPQIREALTWLEAEHLRTRIADLKSKGTHTCPACAHEWAVEATSIEALEAELEPLSGAVRADGLPDTRTSLTKLLQATEAWEAIQPELAGLADAQPCDPPPLSPPEIEAHRNRNTFAAERARLERTVAALTVDLDAQPDYADLLRERQRYEDRLALHAEQLADYEAWKADRAKALTEIAALEAQVEGYDVLTALRQAVALYDSEWTRYEADLDRYTTGMQSVSETLDEADQWDKVRQALTNLRAMVKQHLVPSLNRVASQYLAQMTGGTRQVIEADDAFNITVDGQALNTLSGSGKAVACLALRLGLGQVLTHGVLSLFIGDEIDASMDADRTANTAALLQSLKSRIGQIVLVTHKRPEADYVVEVGG